MADVTATLNMPNPQPQTASPGTVLDLTDEMITELADRLVARGVTMAVTEVSADQHAVWKRQAAVLRAEFALALASGSTSRTTPPRPDRAMVRD